MVQGLDLDFTSQMSAILLLLALLLIGVRGVAPRDIESIINDYKLWHHNATVTASSVCSSQFIVGRYHCPGQIGNRMFEFLNAFAVSIITNRTLAWSFCRGGKCPDSTLEQCEALIHRRSWIPSLESVQHEMVLAKCPSPRRSWSEYMKGHGAWTPIEISRHPVDNQLQSVLLSCSNIHNTPAHVLDIGVNEMFQSYFMSLGKAMLSDEAAERARILFENGAEFAFGTLFRVAFKFTDKVKAMNDELLAQGQTQGQRRLLDANMTKQSETLIVALHLRHFGKIELGEEDTGEAKCMAALFSRVNDSRRLHQRRLQLASSSGPPPHHDRSTAMFSRCAILIASDRPLSVRRNAMAMHEQYGCTIISRSDNGQRFRYGEDEHGPSSDGDSSVADVELLSRAHVLMGTTRSTFSALIGGLVITSTNAYLRQRQFSLSNSLHTPVAPIDHEDVDNAEADEPVDASETEAVARRRLEFYRYSNGSHGLNFGDSVWLPQCAHTDVVEVDMRFRAAFYNAVISSSDEWVCPAALELLHTEYAEIDGAARRRRLRDLRVVALSGGVTLVVLVLGLLWRFRYVLKRRPLW